jgi:hypothetical protein
MRTCAPSVLDELEADLQNGDDAHIGFQLDPIEVVANGNADGDEARPVVLEEAQPGGEVKRIAARVESLTPLSTSLARDFRAARLLSRRIEPAASPGYPALTIFVPLPAMDCLTNPEPDRGELVPAPVVAWGAASGLV